MFFIFRSGWWCRPRDRRASAGMTPPTTSSITLSLLWKKHFNYWWVFCFAYFTVFLFLWTIKFEGLYTSADKGDTNDRSTHVEDDTRLVCSELAESLDSPTDILEQVQERPWSTFSSSVGRWDSASLSMLCGRGRGQKLWNFLFLHWFSSVSVTGWCFSCCKESFDLNILHLLWKGLQRSVGVWNDGGHLNKMMVKMLVYRHTWIKLSLPDLYKSRLMAIKE